MVGYTFEEFRAKILNDLIAANNYGYYTKIEIISCPCPVCKKDDGKLIHTEKAIQKMPIPHINCRRPHGCCCTFGVIGIRKRNGMLKEKK